uniref:Guanylate-binding protein N-terminal domain-containing protein n=1 Tax=Panagrolaimus davidi TaxID=227884 RepID=A0A914QUP0_9BILA
MVRVVQKSFLSPVRNQTIVNRAVQIVEHVAEGQFRVNEEALRKLLLTERVANKKIAVYCIAGESRSGKSFLLNFGIDKLNHDEEQKGKFPSEAWQLNASKRLAGFEFRNGVDPTTMGIWAWDHVPLIEHGNEEYAVLMVLKKIDSQGTFDKNTTYGDCSTILSMAGIFSNYFCYNVKNNLLENELNDLYSFVNHGTQINDDLGGNGKLFQNLVFIVRDFEDDKLLKLKNGGQIYVQNQLANAKLTSLKETRDGINASYEKLYGFILPHPGTAVSRKSSPIICEMDDEFVHLTKEMFETLLSPSTLQPKHIGDKTLTCEQAFAYFIDTVQCFNDNKGYAPQAMYALRRDFLINLEVDRAINIYKSQMDEVFLDCKTGYESAELIYIHNGIVENLKNDVEKRNKNIRAEAVTVIFNRIDKLFDAYERKNETLVEAEKKRVQEVEDEHKHEENVARLEKQRAEEEVKKAEIEAQAQKEKIKHEKNMEYVKAGLQKKALISMEFAETKLEKEVILKEFSEKRFLLPQFWRTFVDKTCDFRNEEKFEKNLSLLKQFQKSGDDDKKWLKCLKQLENEESVIANIELRLGSKKSCTNKNIWKYYIEYSCDRNPMFEVYLRYCRFFISDKKMLKNYRNEIKRIGNSEMVTVFWIDTIEWELVFGDLKTAQSLLKEAVKDLADIPKVFSEKDFLKRRRIQTPSSAEDEDDGHEEDKNEEKVVKKYVDDYEEQDSDEEEEEDYEDESDEGEENEGDESDESDNEKSKRTLKRRIRISSSEDDDVSDSRNEEHQPLPTILPEKCFFTKRKSYQSFSIPTFMAKYITNNANSSLLSKLHQSSEYFYSLRSIPVCHRLVLRNFVEPKNFEYSLFHIDTEMNFLGIKKFIYQIV